MLELKLIHDCEWGPVGLQTWVYVKATQLQCISNKSFVSFEKHLGNV